MEVHVAKYYTACELIWEVGSYSIDCSILESLFYGRVVPAAHFHVFLKIVQHRFPNVNNLFSLQLKTNP